MSARRSGGKSVRPAGPVSVRGSFAPLRSLPKGADGRSAQYAFSPTSSPALPGDGALR